MKSSCNKLSDSISPNTIPKSNKEIRTLLDCLKADVDSYIASLETGKDAFVIHFRESLLPLLRKRGLLKTYESQMSKYVRVQEAKTISTFHNFASSVEKMWSDFRQIHLLQKYTPQKGARVEHFLTESFKLAYVDFSSLLMIASQMFFALEF